MKKLIILLIAFASILACGKKDPMQKLIMESFIVIESQAVGMAEYLDGKEGRLPRSYVKEKDEIITSDSRWWCSGFYPGVLWYLYEYTGNNSHRTWAEKETASVDKEKYNLRPIA